MFDTGHVVSRRAFQSWIKPQQTRFAPIAKYLPPYATTYLPTDPQGELNERERSTVGPSGGRCGGG